MNEKDQSVLLTNNGQIAPMVEHCAEAAAVQVRILFCPLMRVYCNWQQHGFQTRGWRFESFNPCRNEFLNTRKGKQWNRNNNNGES